MEKLKLVKPTKKYKRQAIDYIQEFYKYNSKIHGVGGLCRHLDDYDGWLDKLEYDRNKIPNEEFVPAETYFLIRENDDRIIGMINIRLVLNEKLIKFGGNIGYSIRPTERQKGYNKVNLYLYLLVCQKHGIKEVLLDCDKDNPASARTMKALGGILFKENYDETTECIIQHYRIDVDKSIINNRDKYEEYNGGIEI